MNEINLDYNQILKLIPKPKFILSKDKKIKLKVRSKLISDSRILTIRYQQKNDKIGNYIYKKAGWSYETMVDEIDKDSNIISSIKIMNLYLY